MQARRVPAILQGRRSDAAVVECAVDVVRRSGGFLMLVAVVPGQFPSFNAGPLCVPTVSPEERQTAAAEAPGPGRSPDDASKRRLTTSQSSAAGGSA